MAIRAAEKKSADPVSRIVLHWQRERASHKGRDYAGMVSFATLSYLMSDVMMADVVCHAFMSDV